MVTVKLLYTQRPGYTRNVVERSKSQWGMKSAILSIPTKCNGKSVAKTKWRLGSPLRIATAKFDVKDLSGLSTKEWKLFDRSQKRPEFSVVQPKVWSQANQRSASKCTKIQTYDGQAGRRMDRKNWHGNFSAACNRQTSKHSWVVVADTVEKRTLISLSDTCSRYKNVITISDRRHKNVPNVCKLIPRSHISSSGQQLRSNWSYGITRSKIESTRFRKEQAAIWLLQSIIVTCTKMICIGRSVSFPRFQCPAKHSAMCFLCRSCDCMTPLSASSVWTIQLLLLCKVQF